MSNQEIAKIFHQISLFLEMEDVPFKPQAYEKVARILEAGDFDLEKIYQKQGIDGLERIPGVGKSIALKIEEFLKTGKIKYLQELEKKCPVEIEELTSIEGLGPKTIKTLYKELKIKNLRDLERAAQQGKIRKLENFGEKTEVNILEGIKFVKKSKGRFLLGLILPQVREIVENLKRTDLIDQISPAGSVRRMKETIGDVDILVVPKNNQIVLIEKIFDFFVHQKDVEKIWGRGKTKASIRLRQGFDCDLRIVPQESFGAALQYFTGSKEHNIVLRKIAQSKGLKLNEYGIFRIRKGKWEQIGGEREEEIYKILGLTWIPPEIRENRGEIETSRERRFVFSALIDYDDLKGDLHVHSNWSDGSNSLEELAKFAKDFGYQYLGIADHTGVLKIAHGLDEKKLLSQIREIKKINKKIKDFRLLAGAEVNIKPDGQLDIKDEVLRKLDFVIAGVHSHFKMSKEEMTQRIIKAMKNSYVSILAHPTGQILQQRKAYEIDLEKILKVAKEEKVALEVNSYFDRLDLSDENIRKAVDFGNKLVITTDAHNLSQFHLIELGIAQARRGWAKKKDVLNTGEFV